MQATTCYKVQVWLDPKTDVSVLLIPKQGSQKNPEASVHQGAVHSISLQMRVRFVNTQSFR